MTRLITSQILMKSFRAQVKRQGRIVWTVDSGTTDSISCTEDAFIPGSLRFFNAGKELKIEVASGEVVDAIGIGKVHLNKQLTIKNVLFVPDFTCNLLRVMKTTCVNSLFYPSQKTCDLL